MHKRGQFYLIAAVVIIGMLVGLTTVYNVTRTATEDIAVYDLSSEINFEGSQVLSHGIYNELSDTIIIDNIKTLIEHEALANQENEFIGIYGTADSLTLLVYSQTELGEISIDLGGSPSTVTPSTTTITTHTEERPPNNPEVIVTIDDQDYNFNLKPGQTLFIIVKKERGEERFVASPDGSTSPDYSPETLQ